MLTHGAIAVFAGALGCVVTLFTVGAFSQPVGEEYDDKTNNVESTLPADTLATLPDDELQQLQSAVSSGEAERSQMAETLVQLTRDLADVQAQVQTLEQANAERLALAPLGQFEQNVDMPQAVAHASNRLNRRNQRQTGQERVESLVAAGLDEQTALELQARRDEHQLARLELLDLAAREGWSDSEQLQQRLTELNTGRVNFREELGDDAFDRFLYESGDANRVSIESIISGSAAEIAGLKVGDLITSYDSQRIFRVRELQQATREGLKGEYVQVLFDRGGQLLAAELPRGPLGVTLETSAVTP
ncbi:PDZ domain-containing protein [Granulosicoccus sp.]|nr:PDZ domain-containing protein [Granulosicoccus sp.]MDB4222284.1 PDZ domain-containing protein [Granulosicoccus sp.]